MVPVLGIISLVLLFDTCSTYHWIKYTQDASTHGDEGILDALLRIRRNKYESGPLYVNTWQNEGDPERVTRSTSSQHSFVQDVQDDGYHHGSANEVDINRSVRSIKTKQGKVVKSHHAFPQMTKQKLFRDKQGNVVISHHALPPVHGIPPVKKDKTMVPTSSQQHLFKDKQGNVVISHHALPPVKKDKTMVPTSSQQHLFKDKQGNVVISHHALPPVKKDKTMVPTSSQQHLFKDKQGNVVISHHALPPVKKDKTKNDSVDPFGDKRNLVQFRDSAGKVIATLRDSRNFNDANVTLSKDDDAKRYSEMFRGLNVAKKMNLGGKRTDVKSSQATKENGKIMEIKGIEPNAVDNHRQIKNKNGTIAAIENKNHADIDEKTAESKHEDQGSGLELVADHVHTAVVEDKPISLNFDPDSVTEATKVPIDWKELLHADDIADNVHFKTEKLSTHPKCDDQEKAPEPGPNAHSHEEQKKGNILPFKKGTNEHDNHKPVEYLKKHVIDKTDVHTGNGQTADISKREVSDLAELMDDAIEFYDELDQLDEIEEDTNAKPVTSPRRVKAHNLNEKRNKIPVPDVKNNSSFMRKKKESIPKHKKIISLKKKDEINGTPSSFLRHLHYNENNELQGSKKSLGPYDDDEYPADTQTSYDDDVYVSDGRSLVTKDSEPMYDDTYGTRSESLTKKNSTAEEEDMDSKENDLSSDESYDQSDLLSQVEHSAKKDVNDHPDLSDYVIQNPKKPVNTDENFKFDTENMYLTDNQPTKKSDTEEIQEISDTLEDPDPRIHNKHKVKLTSLLPTADSQATSQSIYPAVKGDAILIPNKYDKIHETAAKMVQTLEQITERHNKANTTSENKVDNSSKPALSNVLSTTQPKDETNLSGSKNITTLRNEPTEPIKGPPDVDDLLDAKYAGDKKLKEYEEEIAKLSQQNQIENQTTNLKENDSKHLKEEMLNKGSHNSVPEVKLLDQSSSPMPDHDNLSAKLEQNSVSSSPKLAQNPLSSSSKLEQNPLSSSPKLEQDVLSSKADKDAQNIFPKPNLEVQNPTIQPTRPHRININLHIRPADAMLSDNINKQAEDVIVDQNLRQPGNSEQIGVHLIGNNDEVGPKAINNVQPDKQVVTITPDLLKESLKNAFRDFAKEIKSETQAQLKEDKNVKITNQKSDSPDQKSESTDQKSNATDQTGLNSGPKLFSGTSAPYEGTWQGLNPSPYLSSGSNLLPMTFLPVNTNSYSPTISNKESPSSTPAYLGEIQAPSYSPLNEVNPTQSGMLDRKEYVNKPLPTNAVVTKDAIVSQYQQQNTGNSDVGQVNFDFGQATGFMQSAPYDVSSSFNNLQSNLVPSSSSLQAREANVGSTSEENSERRQGATMPSTMSSFSNSGVDPCNPMPQCQQNMMPIGNPQPVLQTSSPYPASSFILQNPQPVVTMPQQTQVLSPTVQQMQPGPIVQQQPAPIVQQQPTPIVQQQPTQIVQQQPTQIVQQQPAQIVQQQPAAIMQQQAAQVLPATQAPIQLPMQPVQNNCFGESCQSNSFPQNCPNPPCFANACPNPPCFSDGGNNEFKVSDVRVSMECLCPDGSNTCPCGQNLQNSCSSPPCPSQSCPNPPCAPQSCPNPPCFPNSPQQETYTGSCTQPPCHCKKPPCIIKAKTEPVTIVKQAAAPPPQTVIIKKPRKKIIVKQEESPPEIIYAAPPRRKKKIVYVRPPPPPPEETIVMEAPPPVVEKKVVYAAPARQRVKVVAEEPVERIRPEVFVERPMKIQRTAPVIERMPPVIQRSPTIIEQPTIVQTPEVVAAPPPPTLVAAPPPPTLVAAPPPPALVAAPPPPALVAAPPPPALVAAPPPPALVAAPPPTLVAAPPVVASPPTVIAQAPEIVAGRTTSIAQPPAISPSVVAPPPAVIGSSPSLISSQNVIQEKPTLIDQVQKNKILKTVSNPVPVVSGVVPGGITQTVASVFPNQNDCNDRINVRSTQCIERGFDFTTEANKIKSMNFAKSSDNIERLVKGISRRAHQTGGVVNSDLEEKISDYVAEAIVDAKRSRDKKRLSVNQRKNVLQKKHLDEARGSLRHKITPTPFISQQFMKNIGFMKKQIAKQKSLKHLKGTENTLKKSENKIETKLPHEKQFKKKIPTVADLLQLQSFFPDMHKPAKESEKRVSSSPAAMDTPFKRKILISLRKHANLNAVKQFRKNKSPHIEKVTHPSIIKTKVSTLLPTISSKQLSSKELWQSYYNHLQPQPAKLLTFQSVLKPSLKPRLKKLTTNREYNKTVTGRPKIVKLAGKLTEKENDAIAQHKIKLFEDALSSLRNELNINGEKMFKRVPLKEEVSSAENFPIKQSSRIENTRHKHRPAPSMFDFINKTNESDDGEQDDLQFSRLNDSRITIQQAQLPQHETVKLSSPQKEQENELKRVLEHFKTSSSNGAHHKTISLKPEGGLEDDWKHANDTFKSFNRFKATKENNNYENKVNLIQSNNLNLNKITRQPNDQLDMLKDKTQNFTARNILSEVKNIGKPKFEKSSEAWKHASHYGKSSIERAEEELRKSEERYKSINDAIAALKQNAYLSIVDQPEIDDHQAHEIKTSKFHSGHLTSKLSSNAMRMLHGAESNADEEPDQDSTKNIATANMFLNTADMKNNGKNNGLLTEKSGIRWKESSENIHQTVVKPTKFMEAEFDVNPNSRVASPTMKELKRMQIAFEKNHVSNKQIKKTMERMENKINNVITKLSIIPKRPDSKISDELQKQITIDITGAKAVEHHTKKSLEHKHKNTTTVQKKSSVRHFHKAKWKNRKNKIMKRKRGANYRKKKKKKRQKKNKKNKKAKHHSHQKKH
ncbi:uncharacterized protein LOC130647495 isoform X2 [Hydractinia symbiolongicarpus]|uniref:uncharacterized protein LOC130647495 isoform X2 n=1 Tax=Hydractinia symbiolongicarpus TaxID=13093 RepID=UPI00254B1057|nr:uncharacterized protein LOC130647495 isoform X2 [Hydractinia symbiolongicarpus]